MSWNCSISAFQAPPSHKRRVGLSPEMVEALAEQKERAFIPQKFATINTLWDALGVQTPKACEHGWWRLTPVTNGSVQGLPSLSGLLVATDGIIAVIISPLGKHAFVHLSSFIPTEQIEVDIQSFDSYEGKSLRCLRTLENRQIRANGGSTKKPKAARAPKVVIEDFC